jgi:hypothetical protein
MASHTPGNLDTISVSSDCFHDPHDDDTDDDETDSDPEDYFHLDPVEVENQLLLASRNGRVDVVRQILERSRDENIACDINCKGLLCFLNIKLILFIKVL